MASLKPSSASTKPIKPILEKGITLLERLRDNFLSSDCYNYSSIFFVNATQKISDTSRNCQPVITNGEDTQKSHSGKEKKKTLICLCIAAACLSMPLNGLSPSLSLVAHDMGYSDHERDIYLAGYVGLATMSGQLIGSLISGVIVDAYQRTYLLVISLILGGISCGIFGLANYLPLILFLRLCSGAFQGISIPILFSLIADYYNSEARASNSAIVSSAVGGGMLFGQLFVGFTVSLTGWRFPFFLMCIVSIGSSYIIKYNLREPLRGAKEDGLGDLFNKGLSLPPLTMATFMDTLCIPTVAIMVIQTVPNCIPWGILGAHLHDILATDLGLSMQQATSMIATFGAGAAVGGLLGGYAGGKLYTYNRWYLPLFMSSTMAMSAILIQKLMITDFDVPGSIMWSVPLLLMCGALAAVNGANARLVILQMTSPMARGATIAVLNAVNCIGRGIGPWAVEIWMDKHDVDRRSAVSKFMYLWVFAALMTCITCFTIAKDEDKMKNGLKKYAEDSLNDSTNQNKEITPLLNNENTHIRTPVKNII
jgi:MFS family permease